MIHQTAIIEDGAEIGAGVSIGPFTVVHASARVGDGGTIGSHCVIGQPSPLAEGEPLVIGEGATIRSHSVFYAGSTFGPGLTTGHRVTVREKTAAGAGFQIGTLSDIQGHVSIGEHVRTHSNVHICQQATIGDYCWIYPYVVLTNDSHPPSNGPYVGPTLGRFSIVATHACVLPGIEVGEHALIGAAAMVTKHVPDRAVVAGVPAKQVARVDDIALPDGDAAYPWPLRFTRGYPDAVVAAWQRELNALTDAAE